MNYIVWPSDKTKIKGIKTGSSLINGNLNSDALTIMMEYTLIDELGVSYILDTISNTHEIFNGTGIDVGGGVSLISSVIEKKFSIQKIFCVEIVEEAVKYTHEKIQKYILGKKSEKIISVNGDFDHLQLESNSIDFIIGWDAFHHSDNIIVTLNECNRVLKNNRYLVVIDKVHNNSIADSEIDRMLNVIYDKDFLKSSHIDENEIIMRKDDGEHEYRFFEWESFFEKTGFKILQNFLIKTNSDKKSKNDNNLEEIEVDFKVGGFQQQKVIYVLKKT